MPHTTSARKISGAIRPMSPPVAAMLLWVVCMCSYTASAQDPGDSIVTSARQLQEVSVTAITAPVVAVSTPMPLQTLGASRLNETGVTSVADAVRRFAGATVRDYGGAGGLKTVSVRNMGASHTIVSYDGAPVNNLQGGQVDISNFSLYGLSSISLAVGQGMDLLQSARLSAGAGVLSLQSAEPTFLSGRCQSLKLQLLTGAWGMVNPYMQLWQSLGSSGYVGISGDYTRASNRYPYIVDNGATPIRQRRQGSQVESVQSALSFKAPLSAGHQLTSRTSWRWSQRGLPGSVIFYNYASSEILMEQSVYSQIRYRYDGSSRWKIQALAKYTYGHSADNDYGPRYTNGRYHAGYTQHESYLSLSATMRLGRWANIALAQDVQYNTLESTMSSVPSPRRMSALTALTARWHKGALQATATGVFTHQSDKVATGPEPSAIDRIDPTLAVSIQPFRNQKLYLRAMYKRAFRSPTFNDLYYDRMGNRSVRPERATQTNLGLSCNLPVGSPFTQLSISADAYYNNVSDKIVAYPTTFVWKMVNFGRARVVGVDMTASAQCRIWREINASLVAAYTWQRATDRTTPSDCSYGSVLPYSPQHSGNISVALRSPWVTLGYSMVAVGSRYQLPENVQNNRIRGYVEQSISASHRLQLHTCALTLRAELLNMADSHYEVICFYPMPGRHWRAGINFEF